MIERIAMAGAMGLSGVGAMDVDARRRPPYRRRARPAATRDGVTIAWDAAEIGGFADLEDEEDRGAAIGVAALAGRIARSPNRSLAAQARLGQAAVMRLIAVNAMNRA